MSLDAAREIIYKHFPIEKFKTVFSARSIMVIIDSGIFWLNELMPLLKDLGVDYDKCKITTYEDKIFIEVFGRFI